MLYQNTSLGLGAIAIVQYLSLLKVKNLEFFENYLKQ